MKIVVVGGDTDADILAQLRRVGLLGPDTPQAGSDG
jgi:hypothetical protein